MYLLFDAAITAGTFVVFALIAVMLHRQSAKIVATLIGRPVSAAQRGAAKLAAARPAFA